MSTATESMSVADAVLAERRKRADENQRAKEAAREVFSQMVDRMFAGELVPLDELDPVMATAGLTDAHLAAAIERRKQIGALATDARPVPELKRRLPEVRNQRELHNRETDSIIERRAKERVEFDEEEERIQAGISKGQDARAKLAELLPRTGREIALEQRKQQLVDGRNSYNMQQTSVALQRINVELEVLQEARIDAAIFSSDECKAMSQAAHQKLLDEKKRITAEINELLKVQESNFDKIESGAVPSVVMPTARIEQQIAKLRQKLRDVEAKATAAAL